MYGGIAMLTKQESEYLKDNITSKPKILKVLKTVALGAGAYIAGLKIFGNPFFASSLPLGVALKGIEKIGTDDKILEFLEYRISKKNFETEGKDKLIEKHAIKRYYDFRKKESLKNNGYKNLITSPAVKMFKDLNTGEDLDFERWYNPYNTPNYIECSREFETFNLERNRRIKETDEAHPSFFKNVISNFTTKTTNLTKEEEISKTSVLEGVDKDHTPIGPEPDIL